MFQTDMHVLEVFFETLRILFSLSLYVMSTIVKRNKFPLEEKKNIMSEVNEGLKKVYFSEKSSLKI